MSKNKITDKLNRIQQQKEQLPQPSEKAELVNKILNQEEETIDMKAIADALQEQNKEKAPGLNEGYTKDTLYIEDDIYKAFNALCVNRGDKKKFVNEALKDFVIKRYKEMNRK